ncbi:sulfotransferase family protein [Puniceicoccus vermicola]|uniref:Sulfotransferase family 2 domain-containing protein n=1 Tax=Puniceicoccus vermicola TaxID=388746 RepID=A0A7X1E374_9BACT|nr:sulfotransferase family protein [Puniceicoccus vermicola]MBC2601190.1 sulfotransferase family 2 domain-containing protein [Puniceicoccus vermicola]
MEIHIKTAISYLMRSSGGSVIPNHEKRYLFFVVPKVACSSWKNVIANDLRLSIGCTVHKTKFPQVFRVGRKYDGYFKFGFVRNPFDRLWSCFNHKIHRNEDHNSNNYKNGVANELAKYYCFKGGMSFPDFVEAVCGIPDYFSDQHFRSQHTFLYKGKKPLTSFVGRFEQIQEDAEKVLKIIDYRGSFPHVMGSRNLDYSDFYSEKMRKLVEQRYFSDLRLFNYKF